MSWDHGKIDMKQTAIPLIIAAMALAGCKKPQTPEPAAELPVESRSLDRLTPAAEADAGAPTQTETATGVLSDSDIETAIAGTVDTGAGTSADAGTGGAPEGQAVVHTIEKGDTFWSLAKRYLGSGHRWKEIAAANPNLVHNKLPIGTKVRIPMK